MLADRSNALVEAMPWLDDVAGVLQQAAEPLLGQDAPRGPRDLLYGVWLGHPLHPAIVTMPLGCWTASAIFDLMGEERAADLSLGLGLATAPLAVLTGAAQYQDATNDESPRRLGALHATLNVVATLCFAGSLAARKQGSRTAGMALSTLGLGIATVSAWLGGDLSYDLGLGVDHAAFEEPPQTWTDACAVADLADGKPKRVDLPNAPVMLLRHPDGIHAIGATCSHLGGPLDEGKIDGEMVTCPWHGSVFCLLDGAVQHGPATMSVPGYDVRIEGDRVQVRLAQQPSAETAAWPAEESGQATAPPNDHVVNISSQWRGSETPPGQ
ncbi:MAG TPA: Rieske 2Fe-2S domain-containing protein [Thermomicrobiales bacterium]|nr:Rieske 2Fe-2S domain-containing protein [Thermomicrobiales bacterium]